MNGLAKGKYSEVGNRAKKVKKYTKNMIELQTYSSINIASKENNITSTRIVCCLKGKNKTAGGYIWRYA